MSFSNIIFALILKLHEKHFYHLDGSKPVMNCLQIKLVRNHCVNCSRLNFSHCLHLRKVPRKKEKNRRKSNQANIDKVRCYGATEAQFTIVFVILD